MTVETLIFEPIASSIVNRGTFQSDIELFGLTYLQKISNPVTGRMLHIEPGIWVMQPATSEPLLSPPPGGQLVTRMANIPHGNSLVAQGTATPFDGPPTISPGANPISGGNPAFSYFPSFNSTPMTPPFPTPIFSAGTSELQSKRNHGFSQYTLTNAASTNNPRTPLEPPFVLDPGITQDIVNDPIVLLQQKIQEQVGKGHQFRGAVTNISSSTKIEFLTRPAIFGLPAPATVTVYEPAFGGGIENLSFIRTNAETVLVYATFWIEKVTHPDLPAFMQLQYAQMVLLNFPAISIPTAAPAALSDQGKPNFSWPHVSVATLRKTFNR